MFDLDNGQSMSIRQSSHTSYCQCIQSKRKENRDNGREERIISIDLLYTVHHLSFEFSFISTAHKMTYGVYSYALVFLFFIANNAQKSNRPLQGKSSTMYTFLFICLLPSVQEQVRSAQTFVRRQTFMLN
jgi:hypothetical protein